MSSRRSSAAAALLVAAGLALAGCGGSAGAETTPTAVASVHSPPDGGPGIVSLADSAARRLVLRTTAVAGTPGALVVPYGAVVYQPDGSSWVYVQLEPLTYQRAPVTITGISGEQVTLSSGPQLGTPVVTQGAPELVGVETGIDGEE